MDIKINKKDNNNNNIRSWIQTYVFNNDNNDINMHE